MNKGGFLDDTFEKALEAGQSMTKAGAKQIKQTFNPLQMLKSVTSSEAEGGEKDLKNKAEAMKKAQNNNTPLDFNNLQKSYGKEDDAKAKALANRLFQMVKSGDEKVYMEKKQKEEEKKQQEIFIAEDRKRKDAEKRKQQETAAIPQGKERKSILGGKKKKSGSTPAPAEIKPSQGKQ